jgi:hypothetical protein
MARFRELNSMALSDEELHDIAKLHSDDARPDLPDYPPGLCFTIQENWFEALGIRDPKPGATVGFAAFAKVTSVNLRTDGCRIELEFIMLSLDEGEFVELDEGMSRPSICLDENDHDRLDLDEASAEKGHVLHVMGEARVMAVDDSRYGGKSVRLQIEEAVIEDESAETEDEMEDEDV